MYTEELVFEHGKLLPESNGLLKFAYQCYKEAGSNLNFMLPTIDFMQDNHMIVAAAFAYIFLANKDTVIDVNGLLEPTFELHKTIGDDAIVETENGSVRVRLVDEEKFSIANKMYILCMTLANITRGEYQPYRHAEADDMPGLTTEELISMAEDAMFSKDKLFSCLPLGVEVFSKYVKLNRDIESAADEYTDDLVNNFKAVDKIYAQILRMFYFHQNC